MKYLLFLLFLNYHLTLSYQQEISVHKRLRIMESKVENTLNLLTEIYVDIDKLKNDFEKFKVKTTHHFSEHRQQLNSLKTTISKYKNNNILSTFNNDFEIYLEMW